MKIKRFLMVVLGCLICAFAFNIFLSPYKIMPGGVSGIAIIFKKIFSIEESITIFLLSVMILLISLIMLGVKSTARSVLGSFLYPLFVYLTSLVLVYFNLTIDNRLLASIVGGITMGIGIGIVYKVGYTTGGVDILAKIFNKYFHISLGTATFLIDSIITICGAFIFGFETLIYSIITIYIVSIMIDKVILGFFGNKSFYIITTKPKEIKEFILNELGHGATVMNGHGAYSKEKRSVILSVIPTSDYYKLKDGLTAIDSDAFFVACDSYEVGGGK